MNVGKRFEQNFKYSVPNDMLLYRLNDSAQSFNQNNGLRFSLKNPFDFILYKFPILMALELKTVAGTSVSFERNKLDKGVIHLHQMEGLLEWSKHKGVVAGFILNFRHKDDTETCYFLEISNFYDMINNIQKKSFNEKDLNEYNPIIIKSKKLKVNYKYYISAFIEDVNKMLQEN